ncbi:MAG TPA: hypothetical protein VM347_22515 [Nonomuraea sp.]|nr:hypothetical protein [Nonomuraea sp.]
MPTASPPDHADPRSGPYEPHEDLRRALLSLPRRQRAIVRSFLLAAAETAAREPAKSGSYWYTRQRTIRPAQYTGQRGREETPFSATVASTQESWYAAAKARATEP